MAPRNKAIPVRREADVGDMLTPAQKNELTLLVTGITDAMRDQITHNFELPAAAPLRNGGPAKAQAWCMGPSSFDQKSVCPDNKENTKQTKENRRNTERDRRMEPELGTDTSLSILDSLSSVVAPIRDDDDILAPSLENLKKDALAAFRRWQTALVKRMGEITISKENAAQKASSVASPLAAKMQQRSLDANKAPGKMSSASSLYSEAPGGKSKRDESDLVMLQLYGPVATSLCSLPMERKRMLLHSMLLLLLSLESYTAYSRVLLLHMASSFQLPPHEVADDEVRVGVGLSQMAKEICAEEPALRKPEDIGGKNIRRWKTGSIGGTTGPSAQTGGGLAEPLEAAGVGSIIGRLGHRPAVAAALLGSMADNSVVVGTLFGIYGGRGAGKMTESYVKDISDFAFLPLYGPPDAAEFVSTKEMEPDHRRLRVIIGASGWLTDERDLRAPWRALGSQGELYALQWDAEMLAKMGSSLETVARSTAWSKATEEIAKREKIAKQARDYRAYKPLNILRNEAALASPHGALWPPDLLKISKNIDNPWCICLVRADKAGSVLADAIMSRIQGERTVSLVGFSLGARAIYMCLMILAERRVLGLVENVVLMGAPVPADSRVWSAMRTAVTGRLVNVYSENDYILGFLSRTGSVQFGVAGLQCIESQPGVENIDASRLVTHHLRYQYLVGSILQKLGWEDIDKQKAAEDEETLRELEEKLGAKAARDAEASRVLEERLNLDRRSVRGGVPGATEAAGTPGPDKITKGKSKGGRSSDGNIDNKSKAKRGRK